MNNAARTSPNDDFAQTFTKVIYDQTGWTTTDADAPAKENVIKNMLEWMRK